MGQVKDGARHERRRDHRDESDKSGGQPVQGSNAKRSTVQERPDGQSRRLAGDPYDKTTDHEKNIDPAAANPQPVEGRSAKSLNVGLNVDKDDHDSG